MVGEKGTKDQLFLNKDDRSDINVFVGPVIEDLRFYTVPVMSIKGDIIKKNLTKFVHCKQT